MSPALRARETAAWTTMRVIFSAAAVAISVGLAAA
eukprot:COSAG04_NODE_7337_length_1145_cov_1.016252_2_plen_34_part_01